MTSGHQFFLFTSNFIQNYFSIKIFLESASCPAWEFIYCICARPSVSSSDLLKSWGGGGVAVACGARLSCSIFMVYSLLLSMALVARAPI